MTQETQAREDGRCRIEDKDSENWTNKQDIGQWKLDGGESRQINGQTQGSL